MSSDSIRTSDGLHIKAPLILNTLGITVTAYTVIIFDMTCQRYAKFLLFRKFLFFPNKISRKEFDSPIWDGSLSNLLFRTSSQTKLTKSPKIEPGSSLLVVSSDGCYIQDVLLHRCW